MASRYYVTKGFITATYNKTAFQYQELPKMMLVIQEIATNQCQWAC